MLNYQKAISAKLVTLGLAASLLAGCGAEFNSIHRNVRLPVNAAGVQLIDAKQRAIITVPGAAVPGTEPFGRMMVCAEPSPDVFAVNAAAATANGSFGQSGTPANISVGLGFSGSSSEQASTIGRTQTVNLLKEEMYRTCERFINNGIGWLELSVQAARDQRLIVATLAIEQLTGVVMPKATVIGSFGETAGGGSAADAVVTVDAAQKAQATAQKAEKDANDAYAEASKDGAKNDACKQIAAASDPANPGDTLKDKVEGCNKATAAQVAAQAKLKTANDNLATIKQALNAGGGLVTSASSSVQGNSGAGGLDQAKPESIREVTAAVENIVRLNYAVDEFELLCIKALDSTSGALTKVIKSGGKTLQDKCIEYFYAKLEQATAQSELQANVSRIAASDLDRFQIFWALATDVRNARIDAILATKTADASRLKELRTATDATIAAALFARLGDASRAQLTKP